MIDVTAPPKLMVCDLDDGILADLDLQANLLETWLTWTDANRPLLLFHSRMSIDELERDLPATTLPPADFLVGAGVSMLARLTRWHDASEQSKNGPWAEAAAKSQRCDQLDFKATPVRSQRGSPFHFADPYHASPGSHDGSMTWFIVTNWAFVTAILFVLANRRGMAGDQMIWTGLLCALWPLLLAFFLMGSAFWALSSTNHAIKRRRR
jgi:hypothetical protein